MFTSVNTRGNGQITLDWTPCASQSSNLTMNKTATFIDLGRPGLNAGDLIEYTVCIDNPGETDLTAIQVNDTMMGMLPFDSNFTSGTSSCYAYNYTITQSEVDM
jgi:uncharacterized repeat protein (TIGR01451 family)